MTPIALERKKSLYMANGDLDLETDKRFVDFGGSDACAGDCKGWDGLSRSCDCAETRVEWEVLHGDVFPIICEGG